MKEKVIKAYDKLAGDYERHVDSQSGHNAYYERPAMMHLLPANMEQMTVLMLVVPRGGIRSNFLNEGPGSQRLI